MLDTLLARYRTWQLKFDTIRYLEQCDDRQLADMGINRDDIVTVARRNAKLALQRRRAAHPAGKANRQLGRAAGC